MHGRRYATRAQARSEVFSYVETLYNPRRRHSTLGYVSPREFPLRGEGALTRVQVSDRRARARAREVPHVPGRGKLYALTVGVH